MHASRDELPILFGDETAGLRGIDWHDQRVGLVSLPAGGDYAPLFQGLPNDMCPAPHWGYIVKGHLRVMYADSTEETLQAGDLFIFTAGTRTGGGRGCRVLRGESTRRDGRRPGGVQSECRSGGRVTVSAH